MLRSITPKQLDELIAYSQLEPFGEERMDFRFSILAAAMVGASGGTIEGRAYTPADFLRSLAFNDAPPPEEKPARPAQSVEYMTGLLNVWIDGSNDNPKFSRLKAS